MAQNTHLMRFRWRPTSSKNMGCKSMTIVNSTQIGFISIIALSGEINSNQYILPATCQLSLLTPLPRIIRDRSQAAVNLLLVLQQVADLLHALRGESGGDRRRCEEPPHRRLRTALLQRREGPGAGGEAGRAPREAPCASRRYWSLLRDVTDFGLHQWHHQSRKHTNIDLITTDWFWILWFRNLQKQKWKLVKIHWGFQIAVMVGLPFCRNPPFRHITCWCYCKPTVSHNGRIYIITIVSMTIKTQFGGRNWN